MEDQRSVSLLSTTRENRATGNTEVSSALRQKDDGNKENFSVARVASIRPTKARGKYFGWWWEVYAMSLSVASTIAVIAVLISVQGKPLAEWKMPIQPNSLVAIFSTIAKSALLVPIAECISQLKWTYFESPRTLSQLQLFDDASRGPWGSLILLWKTKATALLASLGAFITILLLAFEPFTQQVVRVQVKNTLMKNETSDFTYALSFTDPRYKATDPDATVDPQGRMTFAFAIMAAMTGRSSPYESNRVCGTSLCTYPSYVSLSARNNCDTRKIRTTSDYGCTYYYLESNIEPNDTLTTLGVSLREQSKRHFNHLQDLKDVLRDDEITSFYGMECNITKPDFPRIFIDFTYDPETKIRNLIGASGSSEEIVFGNAEVNEERFHRGFGTDDLYPSNITGSNFSFCTSRRKKWIEPLYQTLDNFTLSTFSCLDTDGLLSGISNLDSLGEFDATVTHCNISLASAEYVNNDYGNEPGDDAFRSAQENATSAEHVNLRPLRIIAGPINDKYEDVAKSVGGPSSNFTIGPRPMIHLAGLIEDNLSSDNAKDFLLQRSNGNWSVVIEDITKVAGDFLRSSGNSDADNIPGKAWGPQPFIEVKWAWLILPLSLIVLSVGFLTLTVVQSRKKTYLYKTSVLAATLHGLEGWNAEEMRVSGEKVSGKDLVEMAKGMKAQFMSEEGESVRFVRRS